MGRLIIAVTGALFLCGFGAAAQAATPSAITPDNLRARIMAADTDHDGRVSLAEFTAASKGGQGNPARRFQRNDTNHDGYLDAAEIQAMVAKRIKMLDTDGDGVVSKEELAARHDARTPKTPPPANPPATSAPATAPATPAQ